jgi:GNAT superfamily N-acetyltransferase
MKVIEIESAEQLSEFKHQYMGQTTAPLDGMWLCGFVPMASHYGFSLNGELAGFFCVNAEGYLLQFFVQPQYRSRSSEFFGKMLQTPISVGEIKGAFVSTAEPLYLSLCFDHLPNFKVNALMYQLDNASAANNATDDDLGLTAIAPRQLAEAVEFAVASIGAPAEWLEGYFRNLISREELFGVWENGTLVATGESRGYDEYQTSYADVGVIVAKSERGRGLATRVLKRLVALNEVNGLRSICSTEKANVGAQKAITRAGFSDRNRIIQFNT